MLPKVIRLLYLGRGVAQRPSCLTQDRRVHGSIPGAGGRLAQHCVNLGNSSLNLPKGPQRQDTSLEVAVHFTQMLVSQILPSKLGRMKFDPIT